MSDSEMANGTGYSRHGLDREKRIVEIDFSGYDGDSCYRNDASILFFAANSYKSAFLVVGRELEKKI